MDKIITDKCREDFIKWAKQRSPFNFNRHTNTLTCFGKSFFDLPLVFQLSAIMEFADSEEFCVHIEPALGGGQPAYFSCIRYRDSDHIDMHYEVDNGNSVEFWTRFTASEMAIRCLNELYNKQKQP